jgi:homoserine kinase
MIISVPASSANMGPGFDAIGLALDLPFHCRLGPDKEHKSESEAHPATIAFRRLGGIGPISTKTSIPSGRGLGFSGAARVAGLLAALVQQHGPGLHIPDFAAEILSVATELEGHADNVAASLHGGCMVSAAGRVVRVPLGLTPAVVVWIPATQTSTAASRNTLPGAVPFVDAVFNIARTAMLVAALAGGDTAALRDATQDRLHQANRLRAAPRSQEALEAALAAGAWGAWLSGSGPTVAAFCSPDAVHQVIAALPEDGRVRQLDIDHAGACVLPAELSSR